MEVILNIGLDGVPVNGETYTNGRRNPRRVEQLMEAVHVARRLGFEIRETRMLQSDTEPTAVMVANWPAGNALAVYQLAQRLNQQCIAAYLTSADRGELHGPQADAWGGFNPEFFIMPGGTRLAQPAAAKAA